jgi:hypothetical protein
MALGVLAVGSLGALAVGKYQQLSAVPTNPPAARSIVTSPPPMADEMADEKRGEAFRQHVAGAQYTVEDSADLTGDWQEASKTVTHISGDVIHRRVSIRTSLEPADTERAHLIAAVFALWSSRAPSELALGEVGADWPEHGALSVYAADETLLVANANF